MNQTRREIPLYVVLPPGTLLMDVAGPMEVFRRANIEQSDLLFDYCYISTSGEQSTSIGLMVSGLEPLPNSLPEDAWVLISGSLIAATQDPLYTDEYSELSDWLSRTITATMTLVTVCAGALLAGRAGLLDGRQCTTHADCIDALRVAAPQADVKDNRLFVIDGPVFSSAGISTGIDLALHIVSQQLGPTVALRIARQMVLYMRRSGNDPQISPWLQGRNHIHPAIHRAQDAIIEDPTIDWTLGCVANAAHLSERHLSRLFREQTGMGVNDYVNLIRVSLARDILLGPKVDMEEVALRSGFSSARHLRRVWAKYHDEPPRQTRSPEPH